MAGFLKMFGAPASAGLFRSRTQNPAEAGTPKLGNPYILVAIQTAAFWPVWRWYANRVVDGSDDAWGVVAFVTALLFIFRQKAVNRQTRPSLWLPLIFTVCYAASYPFLPPLPRGVIAITAVASTISILRCGQRMHLGLLGLLTLSLPLIASLQFFSGYPLRLLVAMISAPLLGLNGLAVVREGTALNWAGMLVEIDAPCGGVKMLWAGMFLTFTLACIYRLSTSRTVLAAAFALVAIVLGNVLRATALFYVEAGIIHLPSFAHTGIGIVVFMITATTVAYGIRYAKRTQPASAKPLQPETRLRVPSGWPGLFTVPLSPLFVLCCLLATFVPLPLSRTKAVEIAEPFPGWPANYEGVELKPLPLSAREARFTADFPGRIARFTDGKREIVLRWITRETRTLHPAPDCFKALGYSISPLPLHVDQLGRRWSQFEARRGDEMLQVYERIHSDRDHQSWTDVSSWYWQSLLGLAPGPWWAVTIAENSH